MITLTRRYHFSASHRLHSPALSAAENARIFGKCNNPFGHGHNYMLDVTVPASGLIVNVPALDRLVTDHVLKLFSNRNINLDIPQFAHLIPTTENVTLVIADLLKDQVRLVRIHIQETDRNGFEVLLNDRRHTPPPHHENESVTVHA
jgi:6-pyruvoyltetrahydropterin/6-carboxytetrahydropterin synthase